MRMKVNGNKRDIVAVVIKNAEASSTIPLGAPVCAIFNGTDDGLAVVLPATAADVLQSTAALGVSLGAYTVGTVGEAQVFGMNSYVKLMRTRAASSDTFAAIAAGALLKAESVNNSFQTVATNGASAFLPAACVALSLAAVATTAASTQTMTTQMCTGFFRMM